MLPLFWERFEPGEEIFTPTAPGRHGAAPQPHEEDTREGAKSWKERFWGISLPPKTTGIMKLPFFAVDQTQCKKMSPFSCACFLGWQNLQEKQLKS